VTGFEWLQSMLAHFARVNHFLKNISF
jgi:hypothetical protein